MALVLSFFLAGVSPAAWAAEPTWKAIAGKGGTGGILYDPSSVTRPSRDAVRVWIRKTAQQRILEEFHCSYKIVRDVQVVTELPNKPPRITFVPSEWRGVVKESPLGELFGVICR